MGPLGWILGATVGVSLIAWIGVLTLFLRTEQVEDVLLGLVALAAGSLLGGAFLHLLPSAIAATDATATFPLFLSLVARFCLFFALEQFLHWHHHHGATHEHEPVSYLVLVSDALHNFIDGLVIAGAFLVNPRLGLVTTAAIGLHEIPQEIGDFGILVYSGFDSRRALVYNYCTQATVIAGGVTGFFVGTAITGVPATLLAFAAGNFVYIAASDLVPEIKREANLRRSLGYFSVFVAGIGLMLGVRYVGGLLS